MRLELKVSRNFPVNFQEVVNNSLTEEFLLYNLIDFIGGGRNGWSPSCYIERSFIRSNGAKIIHTVCHLDAQEARAMLPQATEELLQLISKMLCNLLEFNTNENFFCEVWIDLLVDEVLGPTFKYNFVKKSHPSQLTRQELNNWLRCLPEV